MSMVFKVELLLHLVGFKALIQVLYILFCHFVYGHAGFPEDAIFSKTWLYSW